MQKKLNHIAIIPDGNRRWARSKGLPTFEGHRRGFNVVKKLLDRIWDLGINTATLWALSTENLDRTKEELAYLMKIYERMLTINLKDAIKREIRIKHLGRKDRIPKSLLQKINKSEEKTKNYKKGTLNIAIDYGGRDEVLRATEKINSSKKSVRESEFESFLDTAGETYPNPDLIIRTGGAIRTSGFMIWQAAYSEYAFIEKYLPDVTVEDLETVINDFKKRERRFGK